jgi:multidrug efflux pump subunit AcrA (membrane-fusion protein)
VSKRSFLVIGGLVVLVAGGYAAASRYGWIPFGAVAQSPQPPAVRAVAVEVATATKKSTPVQIEALGTVTPIASVAIKSRLDTEITEVLFSDGARVKQGDVLVKLDGRAIEAQILQAEGNIQRDKAQLEGAERDIRRYTELVAKNATPVTNLDNAKTQAAVYAAAAEGRRSDPAESCTCSSAIRRSARRSPDASARRREGREFRALRRPAADRHDHPDRAGLCLVPMPQLQLPALRDAIAEGSSSVEAVHPRASRTRGRPHRHDREHGRCRDRHDQRARRDAERERAAVARVTLVQTYLNCATEEAVTVPSAAVQVSQTGNFVYVIKNDVAELHPVKVARTLGDVTVLQSGVNDGDAVVVNGHLQLTNGARVAIRAAKKADS